MTASNQKDEKPDNTLKKEDGKDNVALLEARADVSADPARVSFLTSEDEEARIRLALDRGVFIGFSKDELLRFEKDPGWRRLRLVLLILFWFAWALLLLAAVIVIVLTPACPARPALQWPEKFPIYQINVPSFRVGSRCVQGPTHITGNVDGVLEVLTSTKDNYFDRIQPADIYWLRGLHKFTDKLEVADPGLLDKDISGGLEKLFEAAKKKQRRILLDLLPYTSNQAPLSKLSDLRCGIFAHSNVKGSDAEVKVNCFSKPEEVEKLTEFVLKYRNSANGFVLDYNQWLLNATDSNGKNLLEKLVETVTRGSGGESASGDNAKHLFMRFPVLDKRFVEPGNEALLKTRIEEEELAKKAGIRVIIETIAMSESDENACSTVECLAKLVNAFNGSTVYRSFAIDDPLFATRTFSNTGRTWKSTEALAAFAIAALPGTPIVYYGSEIGMTQNGTGLMQWTDLHNNTCSDQSYMCFCNVNCQSSTGTAPTTRACPMESSIYHEASVREQIRDESNGPLKSFIQLLIARQNNDSLSWGNSNISVSQTTHSAQKILVAMRNAEHFEKLGLFISFGSNSDREAVPHLPENIANSCYQTVYSFQGIPSKQQKQKFSEMVLQKDEVRLVRVYKTCSATTARAAFAWMTMLGFIALLLGNRH